MPPKSSFASSSKRCILKSEKVESYLSIIHIQKQDRHHCRNEVIETLHEQAFSYLHSYCLVSPGMVEMRTRSARIERRASFRYTQKGLHSPAEENSRHAPRAYFDLHFMRAPDFYRDWQSDLLSHRMRGSASVDWSKGESQRLSCHGLAVQ